MYIGENLKPNMPREGWVSKFNENEMKKNLLSISIILTFLSSFCYCQIPNGGFETWYVNSCPNNIPTGYSDGLAAAGFCYGNIARSTNSHSGNYSVYLSNAAGIGQATISAVFVSGNYNGNVFPAAGTNKFHLNTKPNSLSGYYALSSNHSDTLYLYVTIYNGNTIIGKSTASLFVPTYTASGGAMPNYASFNSIISYSSTAIADSASTYFTFEKKKYGTHAGLFTEGYLDDIVFSSTTSINEKDIFNINMYPNPASNSIRINLNNTLVSSIDITDISGKTIYSESLKEDAINDNSLNINTSEFEDGIYFIKFTAKDGQIGTKKISILK